MPNKNYIKGKGREQYIKKLLLEKEGFDIVLRMAGSKGFCDLVAIKKDLKLILFIQVKPKKLSEGSKERLLEENDWVNDEWTSRFEVR